MLRQSAMIKITDPEKARSTDVTIILKRGNRLNKLFT